MKRKLTNYKRVKNIILILGMAAIVSNCKNKAQGNSNADTPKINIEDSKSSHYKGEFIYYEGSAVLQTPTMIYGIVNTNKLELLNQEAQQYKKDPTDMVQVEIVGEISNQPDDKILWENKLKIIEIINVAPSQDNNNIVKLGNKE